MNKQDLLEKILVIREELESALNKVGDQQKSLVILHGEWSITDLLGHLGFWENRVADLYEALTAGKSPEPAKDLDSMNASSIIEMRKKTFSEVELYERHAYQRILAIIRHASEQELFDPGFFEWTNGSSFQELISDNTWGHYAEHLPELNAWLKRMA